MIPIAITYPRSGMHLTAKILGMTPNNTLGVEQNLPNIKRLVNNKLNILTAVHSLRSEMDDETADYLRDNTKIIFIARDPKDILLSTVFLVYGNKLKDKSVVDRFIMSPKNRTFHSTPVHHKTKVEEWKEHVNGWFDYLKDPFVIRYENWINAYDKQAKLLSEYLGVAALKEKPKIEDVARSRLGIVGDHKNYFSKELIDYIDETCKKEIELIDKYLL